jgi:outer membrane protein OmpA-like peptidoglycan-associated protein
LPENFTLQFDVMVNEDFNFYSQALDFTFMPCPNRQKLNDYARFSHPANGVRLSMHPTSAGGNSGNTGIYSWDTKGEDLINNNVATMKFHAKTNNLVRVSIWRQKQRMRVYFNDEKVLDIPRAFDAAAKYNAMTIGFGGAHQATDRYLLSSIRLAVGAPDTRSKLITEGKLVTRGILFDSGSDKIKPESYGALKDIANVLKENADVKVKIIGHTDSDGDDAANMELSKKRAAAVKEALTKEFAIDASRMETDGKGESVPSDKNDTAVGKANNRRVEFVKL